MSSEKRRYSIIAKPNAKENKIEPLGSGTLKAWVTAPPADNAANRQLIKLLAKYFRVAPSNVEMVRGHGNKNKIVEIG